MAALRDVVAFICQNHPNPNELSKARLTKLVYLADWKMCLDVDHQMTETQWYFNHYGPYVPDVEQLARNDPAFFVEQTSNYYGGLKEIIRNVEYIQPQLNENERGVLKFCIENTKNLSWDDFIKLIYSTYPIVTESRFEYLNLPALAYDYKRSETYLG